MTSKTSWFKNTIIAVMLGIFKCTFGLYTLISFRPKLVKNEAKGLKGAYILISNHTNNYDPIFYQAYINRVIRFIIADAVFRNAILRRLLNFVGYIKKRKAVSDISTVRKIIHTVSEGKVVGLFPEGNRNWNGETMPFSIATARLVKMLGVPVVTGNIKGGHLSFPRWGSTLRRGRMDIFLTHTLTKEQVKEKSAEEIHQILIEALHQDDFAWQQEQKARYNSSKIAEELELFIASCPTCKRLFTMVSKDNLFSCSACGASIKIDRYYNFSMKKNIPFDTLRQWSVWQEQFLKERVSDYKNEDAIHHAGAVLYKSETEKDYVPIAKGTLTLLTDGLHFMDEKGGELMFDIGRLQGVCVHFRKGLAFYYDYTDYRVLFESGKVSAFLWVQAIQYMAEKMSKK